ncbi:MAG: NAD-dependent epimerase/dehydratase family protein, partial [Pseudoxanthomonas sp.]
MRILLCGGTGYIGCHTYAVLVERGHQVVVVDNFSNSSPQVLHRLQQV